MKHFVTRVVAVTTLACLLTVFALPAAAAPFGSGTADGLWSPGALFQWIQSVWTGWFEGGDSVDESGGVRSAHDALNNALDPDGAKSMFTTPELDADAARDGK